MVESTYLSVVIPLFNEEENVFPLHEHIEYGLQAVGRSYEIIYVDDGSADSTFSHLLRLASQHQHIRIVQLARNFGQTAAMAAGIAHSSGEVLVFMDGDLQNDARDIPRLLAKLEEGYDVVSGWRRRRRDALIGRKLPSWLANALISRVSGVKLHDYGCTLKAYRRSIFTHLRLYGEMHRFIPAYAALTGARITEIEVTHHTRRFGTSKYGISRTMRVLLDLITLKFHSSLETKPAYAFGFPGMLGLVFSSILACVVIAHRFFPPYVRVHRNPLLPLSISSLGFGVHCTLLGLLAEMVMRTYYEAQNKATYVVKEVISPRQIEESIHTAIGAAKPGEYV
jgi:glycosyltransferase involved in cell wall biosynthesis